MIKKILIGWLILGVIGIIGLFALGYGTYKVADEALKEKEPQLRQYLQMDVEAQNKYVLDNIQELSAKIDLDKDGKPEDKEQWEKLKQLNNQPEIQTALINLGRSVVAGFILFSEPIINDMSDDLKAKYQVEADNFEKNLDKYTKLLEDNGLKMEE